MVAALAALLLDCALTILAVLGFLFNIYILVSVALSKQLTRPSNMLIFHMSGLYATLTLSFLVLSSSTLLRTDSSKFVMGDFVCVFHGFMHLIFQPLALWTLAGIHLDRFISILNPLRYPSILTKKKCALFLSLTWIIVLVACIPTMIAWPSLKFRQPLGMCAPAVINTNPLYPVGYIALTLLAPLGVITGVNMKMTRIARYHRYRIANALFGMTLGGAAQHMNTEGARARDHREQALKHFEGRKAIGTLIQLVGSLLLAYLPTVILVFYETISNHVAHPLALKASLLCLSTAAPVNSFLFGIRNKSIQMILINFVRKELYKNEVQQEIRQRSPGLAGSTRPSMTSIVGQITCQVPYLQRHVSFASLMAIQKPTSELATRKLAKPHPIVRHSSDLSWRVSALTTGTAGIVGGHKSESSTFVNRSSSRLSLAVPDSANTILNVNESPIAMEQMQQHEQNCPRRKSSSALASNWGVGGKSHPSRRRLSSLSFVTARFQNNQESDNLSEDSTSEGDRDSELGFRRSSRVSANHSVKSTFSLSTAVRSMWQQPNNSSLKGKPKITITRVPTIDQTEMGFLYPLDSVTTHEIPSSSPPSTPDDQNNCCASSFAITEKANIVTDKIEHDVPSSILANGQATFVELHYHETIQEQTTEEILETSKREEKTYHFPHLEEIQYATKEIFI